MESLGYSFEESGLPFTEGIESNMDGINNIRNLLKGWDAETFWVPEPHLPEMKEKLVLHAQFLKDSLADANCDSSRSLPSTANITMNSSAEFDERLTSLATGTNDEELVLADLKVEKLEPPRELKGGSVSVEESAKRARIANLQSQIPVCIVHGCNKDLSSSKEYHKRHKVCDVHSKTSVVIVNGVRQRFCQQCSR